MLGRGAIVGSSRSGRGDNRLVLKRNRTVPSLRGRIRKGSRRLLLEKDPPQKANAIGKGNPSTINPVGERNKKVQNGVNKHIGERVKGGKGGENSAPKKLW